MMKALFGKEVSNGPAKVFVTGLAVVLALTLGAATAALNPQLESASAQAASETTESSANGQKAPANGGGQRLVGEVFNRTELYFGSEKPGPDVTRQQFDRFVDKKVTPRFPDGLTLLTGYGQFKGSNGKIVQEQSFVLILLYPQDDKKANSEIQEIRKIYKGNFEQESVLRTDSRERISF